MNDKCELAKADNISAAYTMGRLFIGASGYKPIADVVSISHSPLMIYPPQYQVNQCRKEGGISPGLMVPYACSGVFLIAPPTQPFSITVHDSSGARQVQVQIINDPIGQLASAGGTKAASTETSTSPGHGPLKPVAINALLAAGTSTPAKSAPVQTVHATGYSTAFSFAEALTDAIKNLPPDPNSYPDKQTHIIVTGTGALLGGLLGEHKMFVSISTIY